MVIFLLRKSYVKNQQINIMLQQMVIVRDPGKNVLLYFDFITVCNILATFTEVNTNMLEVKLTSPLSDIEKANM